MLIHAVDELEEGDGSRERRIFCAGFVARRIKTTVLLAPSQIDRPMDLVRNDVLKVPVTSHD